VLAAQVVRMVQEVQEVLAVLAVLHDTTFRVLHVPCEPASSHVFDFDVPSSLPFVASVAPVGTPF
jgi:hypothetical protein